MSVTKKIRARLARPVPGTRPAPATTIAAILSGPMLAAPDAVGLAWLVTSRWATLAAAIGAVVAGRTALDSHVPMAQVIPVLSAILLSNLWLWWRVNSQRATPISTAGALVCLDVVLLSWLLLRFGGVLNPASVFYLVQIVLAALVLGRTWAWIVTALSVAGYAAMFLVPTDELHAAQAMHPEIAVHMRGMWIAFALTALIIAILVTRLAMAVERRDRALEVLREQSARASRVASLTTLVAGAAHELSTPLATMAVAAHELERNIHDKSGDQTLAADARLIRAEIDRSRAILDQMAGRLAEPSGEAPRVAAVEDVLTAAVERLQPFERARITTEGDRAIRVIWPIGVVAQALGNLLRNALQASNSESVVRISVERLDEARVRMMVSDRGAGMRSEDLARAGEPFFTTKPAGVGTGLGLFVTRSSIEQLGGSLALSSRLGEGTTASITLPHDVLRTARAS